MPDPVLGPVADGDTFKCILFQRMFEQTIMNVLHYVCSDPTGTPPDRFLVCRELSQALLESPTGIWTQIRANQSDELTHVSHRVQFLREIDFTYPFYDNPQNTTGGVATPAAVANIALSIEKRAFADPEHPREGIGRIQVAGIPNDQYDGGLFKSTYLDDYANLLQDLADPIVVATDVTLLPCLSRKGATLWIDSPIFQCTIKDTVRVMNRRTVGRGF